MREVVLGERGVLAGAARGAVVAIHSTILPETAIGARRRGDTARCRGARRVRDRRRGARGAEAAHLPGRAATPRRSSARARCSRSAPSKIIHAGALGNGAKLKLCLNLVTYIQWAAAYESFALARATGLPQELLEEAGRANGQLTPLMQAFLALHKAPESRAQGRGHAGRAARLHGRGREGPGLGARARAARGRVAARRRARRRSSWRASTASRTEAGDEPAGEARRAPAAPAHARGAHRRVARADHGRGRREHRRGRLQAQHGERDRAPLGAHLGRGAAPLRRQGRDPRRRARGLVQPLRGAARRHRRATACRSPSGSSCSSTAPGSTSRSAHFRSTFEILQHYGASSREHGWQDADARGLERHLDPALRRRAALARGAASRSSTTRCRCSRGWRRCCASSRRPRTVLETELGLLKDTLVRELARRAER